jgi:uncharacterized membrane protein
VLLSERTLKLTLLATGVYHVVIGFMALVSPNTFFDDIGRYGVENSHYVGDVGAFTLAFGVALLIAAVRPHWRVPVLALAAIWYGLHALNHVFDTDEARSQARGWLDTGLIALGALVAAYLAWVAARLNAQARPATPGGARGGGAGGAPKT